LVGRGEKGAVVVRGGTYEVFPKPYKTFAPSTAEGKGWRQKKEYGVGAIE